MKAENLTAFSKFSHLHPFQGFNPREQEGRVQNNLHAHAQNATFATCQRLGQSRSQSSGSNRFEIIKEITEFRFFPNSGFSA